MPSRKSKGNDETDSRRSSLRRLSSIASLTTRNPFNRRRSNNVADSPSTASNASISSTIANAPDHQCNEQTTSYCTANPDCLDTVPPLPSEKQKQSLSKSSSYNCLPDDPIGGMPRSRTFSNLPLPTRAKKSGTPLVQSKSHMRLPSTHTQSSRIPSPPISTRNYSASRLASFQSKRKIAPPRKGALVRSDTEPLLQHALEQGRGIARSTAFKENISPTPKKPRPDLDFFEDQEWNELASSAHTYMGRHEWFDSSDVGEPMLRPRQSSLAFKKQPEYERHTKRLSQKFDSSPSYRSSRDRPPTPGQAVQRWNSQPLLTNTTNFRSSHGEIKQTRLMSERGPPTPPLVKTPGTCAFANSELKRGNITCNHLRRTSALQTLPDLQQRQRQPPARSRAESLQSKPGAITTSQPLAYWTGRFSSLNDRFLNEELAASELPSHHLPCGTPSSRWHNKTETDKLHTPEASTARMRRAMEHLYSLCAAEAAQDSFLLWQKAIANALSLPELAKPVKGSEGRSCALEMSLKSSSMMNLSSGASTPPSGSRKMSFVNRILGRRQKSAAILTAGG